MRLISLRQYSVITIQTIRNTTSLPMREILREVAENPVLYAPVVCYYFSKREIPSGEGEVQAALTRAKDAGVGTQGEFFSFIKSGADKRLIEFVDAFLLFNKERDQTEVKNKCRYFIKKAHNERGISYYKMCKNVGINAGNLYLFINQGKNDRLSWGKCLKLLNYLNQEE